MTSEKAGIVERIKDGFSLIPFGHITKKIKDIGRKGSKSVKIGSGIFIHIDINNKTNSHLGAMNDLHKIWNEKEQEKQEQGPRQRINHFQIDSRKPEIRIPEHSFRKPIRYDIDPTNYSNYNNSFGKYNNNYFYNYNNYYFNNY